MFPKQAIARLLYKLGRMEGSLDAMQEEEQNGFRQGKQGEQGERASLHCHVNVCLKKILAADARFWIINVGLSKIDCDASWFALKQQGMSEHLVWILPCFYYGQASVIKEHDVDEMEIWVWICVMVGDHC